MKGVSLKPANYYVVIDFEATCDKKGWSRKIMEIIEFAAILVDSEFNVVKEFSEFVKPHLRPKLTLFCTELTTITQNDVDNADRFPGVLARFVKFIEGYNPIFCSWGNYDRQQLLQDCKLHDLSYPFNGIHINLKKRVAEAIDNKPRGIGGALRYLNMEFIGTPHRGIDDVRNILRIVKAVQNRAEA